MNSLKKGRDMKLMSMPLLTAALVSLSGFAAEDLTAQLEYVAYPAFVRYQGNNMNASSIIDLQVYHDLIFSGYGNWDGNQGPVTMVPLEPNLKTLTDEGELGT